jgi:hypothetical protein
MYASIRKAEKGMYVLRLVAHLQKMVKYCLCDISYIFLISKRLFSHIVARKYLTNNDNSTQFLSIYMLT